MDAFVDGNLLIHWQGIHVAVGAYREAPRTGIGRHQASGEVV